MCVVCVCVCFCVCVFVCVYVYTGVRVHMCTVCAVLYALCVLLCRVYARDYMCMSLGFKYDACYMCMPMWCVRMPEPPCSINLLPFTVLYVYYMDFGKQI